MWVTVRPAAISVDPDRFENPLEWTRLDDVAGALYDV
jgi:hypothetical protein